MLSRMSASRHELLRLIGSAALVSARRQGFRPLIKGDEALTHELRRRRRKRFGRSEWRWAQKTTRLANFKIAAHPPVTS